MGAVEKGAQVVRELKLTTVSTTNMLRTIGILRNAHPSRSAYSLISFLAFDYLLIALKARITEIGLGLRNPLLQGFVFTKTTTSTTGFIFILHSSAILPSTPQSTE